MGHRVANLLKEVTRAEKERAEQLVSYKNVSEDLEDIYIQNVQFQDQIKAKDKALAKAKGEVEVWHSRVKVLETRDTNLE